MTVLGKLIVLVAIFFSSVISGQSVLQGIDEEQVNIVPVNEFDFAGSWTAYLYNVVYDMSSEKVVLFEPNDTIENIVFNKLIGFPSRAYRLSALGGQNIWKNAVINLDSGAIAFKAYWLGVDDLKWAATATTYAEMGVQFNIDVPDSTDGLDENLFIELVRNEIKPEL